MHFLIRTATGAIGIALVVTLWPARAFAQRPTFELEGIVVDAQEGALSGALVTAKNTSTGFTRAATTDESGRYVISALPPEGEYELRLQLTGFATEVRSGLTFTAGQRATFDLTLKLSPLQETVTVTAEAPMLQTATAEVSSTITQEDLQTLPVRDRNYLRLMMLNSNVVTPFAGSNGIYESGGDVWNVGAYVDGTNNFSKWLGIQRGPQFGSGGFALETIREVKLVTNQFSAEFGGHKFGVISAITKSGANEVKGSAFVSIRPGEWDAKPPLATDSAPYNQQQFGGTLGGPIAKDRLFYFGSYERRRERGNTVVTSPAAPGAVVPTPADEHQGHARFDARISERHSLAVRYNMARWNKDFEAGGLNLPGSGFFFDNDVDTVHAQYTAVLSTHLLNELRTQFSRYYDFSVSKAKTPTIYRAGFSVEGADLWSGAGFGVDPENTFDVSDTISLWRGAHSIKFGGALTLEALTQNYLPYEYGMYVFYGSPSDAPSPSLFYQSFALDPNASLVRPRAWIVGGFVQDDWRVNRRLTLNLGVRYDVETIRDTPGYNAPANKDNVDPRFGIAWDPVGDARWVLRGGVGRFTQQHLMFTVVRGGLFGPNGLVQLAIPADVPEFPTFPNILPAFPPGAVLPPRNIEQISSTLDNESGLQATAGVQRQLRPRTTLSVDFIYTKGWKQGFLDVNHPAPIDKETTRTLDEADATRPLLPTPNGFRQIAELGNQGRSWYRGLRVLVDRRGEPLRFSVSYTLAKAMDMLNHFSVPEDSSDPLLDKAPQNTDQRHNVVIGSTWFLPGHGSALSGWRLSGIAQFHSGLPYTISYGDDRWGTNQADARPGGRNTARGDGYANVDITVARLFKLGRPQLEVRVDAFNVFNNANYSAAGYVGVIGSPNFGEPTGGLLGVFPGRQFQIGSALRF